MYDYLCQRASAITDAAPRGLTTPEQWRSERPRRVQQFHEMMGISELLDEDRQPPIATITSSIKRDGYRIDNLHFQSAPRLYVTANLYVPEAATKSRAPAVLYLCGHSESPRTYYQAHVRRFAELGLVALIIDPINAGELIGYHHGAFHEGWWHWYSRGYTPAGVELYNAIRAVDFLESLSFVDRRRIGVTGISGGGAASWWVAAADERVRCAAPVCATGTFASQIQNRTIDCHCDCMFPINALGWDMVDIAALVAPRPCLIVSTEGDRIFPIESAREVHHRLNEVYSMLGASDALKFVETPGQHSYSAVSRKTIFAWLIKQLAGTDAESRTIIDLDPEDDEPDEVLRVFVDLPRDELNTTIHERISAPAKLPTISDVESLIRHRRQILAALRTKTFAHFPRQQPDHDLKREFSWEIEDQHGFCFSFQSDKDSRLWINLSLPMTTPNGPHPVVLALQNSGDKTFGTSLFDEPSGNYAQASLETRGTGRTSWAQEMQWHLRRAAMLTGRTIASVRVWDTLRALQTLRTLPEIDASSVALAGSGEMAPVVLYAALLDGHVSAVLLHKPPATQDAPGHKQGLGDSIEMLNCLQVTDLPQVAGLLFPSELVFVGPRPSSYVWAEDLYATLGGRVTHLRKLDQWRPTFKASQ